MKEQYITDELGFEFVGQYHMLSKEPKPCMMCGEYTKAIDVFSDGYVCSEECQHEFDSWCNEVLNKANDEE